MNEAHEQLLFKVQGDVFFRRQRVAEYPSDPRNEIAAEAAEAIAGFLEALPDDDRRMVELGRLAWLEGALEGAGGVTETMEMHGAGRVGFQGGPPSDPSAWLDNYVANYRREVVSGLAHHADSLAEEGATWLQPPRDKAQDAEELLEVLGKDEVPEHQVMYLGNLLRDLEGAEDEAAFEEE